MRLFTIILLLLVIGAPLAYVGMTLKDESNTDLIVRLIGPGNEPEICVVRARPNFERMEERLTTAAQLMLASENLESAAAWFDGEVMVNGENNKLTPTQEEIVALTDIFNSFGKYDYYAPYRMRKREGRVFALGGFCGITAVNWILKKLRLPSNGRLTETAYFFEPEGVPDNLDCEDVSSDSTTVTFCDAKLTEHWVWHAEWWDFEERPAETTGAEG